MSQFCCEMMQRNVTYRCDEHPSPFDCPDNVIFHSEAREGYGIIVHDGGASYIAISFCPWCGSNLAKVERGEEKVEGLLSSATDEQ